MGLDQRSAWNSQRYVSDAVGPYAKLGRKHYDLRLDITFFTRDRRHLPSRKRVSRPENRVSAL